MPVARAERPNKARKGLVMLPSAMAIAGLSVGNVGERLGNRAGIEIRRAGDLVDGVDQHLGIQAAQRVAGEIGLGLAGLVNRGIGRELVRAGVQDQAGRDRFRS